MVEIERRFELRDVPQDVLAGMEDSYRIVQGYIDTINKTAVRVRLCGDDTAYLTIKAPMDDKSIGTAEYEYEIPYSDGEALLELSDFMISKTRCVIPWNGYTVELDLFEGANKGLIIAEIEFSTEAEALMASIPDWIEDNGKEVTGDPKYSNMFIAYNTPTALTTKKGKTTLRNDK